MPMAKYRGKLFAPGGSLDSQTTDSQWAAQYEEELLDRGISQQNYADFQNSKLPLSSPTPIGPGSPPSASMCATPSTLASDTPDSTASTAKDGVIAKVLQIIDLCSKDVEERLQIRQVYLEEEVEELRDHCNNLRSQVEAVTTRRDLLWQDLAREREWICLLEHALEINSISFPAYPS
ncbi:hypothetical protein GALMADRAFT_136964 [Galerina marginata CBS 339.88]|uniref:Uncharacterized protein n=1 Tax=Galerina marginata (strain CBS 339.88) TaxID=685588 RepID=A0A067TKS2_GALM3|nr:hypothetical protein GALMADRAFT_136964 [Galerina marginata CBS 339.88]